MKTYSYIGSELELFSRAVNWKNYYAKFLYKYLTGEVLEVGAGIGSTTQILCNRKQNRWVCLEPDAEMSCILKERVTQGELPETCEVSNEFIGSLPKSELFDVIVYIDVLEHIENDKQELIAATAHLKTAGHLIILSPAHQRLFTEFDREIGHFRRYNRKSLAAIIPNALESVDCRYLDSVGMFASLANHLILKSNMPSEQQILFWDSVMIRLSKFVDPLLNYRIGKSILGVWRKKGYPQSE
ncbi:MAG: class I SAM-dependent methyltransferase [Acidobacteriota bacterium]